MLPLYLYLSAHFVAERHWVTSKYQTVCIMLHVSGVLLSEYEVTFDTSVCSTYFPNRVRRLITAWNIKTERLHHSCYRTATDDSQDRRLRIRLRAAASRIWRSVSWTELKPRNSFFASCGWLQVHRFDFFSWFFSCSRSKAHNKKDEQEIKDKFINRAFCPDGCSVRCPEPLKYSKPSLQLTLNPSVGHYKIVPVLNETPHN